MEHLFIKENLEKPSADDLIRKIAEGLLTADMRAATAAGCRFEITMRKEGDTVVFNMKTREKVSIMKMPDGTPISVLVKR